MSYDPLQEKLREMEEKNPSTHQYKQWPWKSLWDKIKFYKRWKNNEVKHIPQKESISVSLEELNKKGEEYFEILLKKYGSLSENAKQRFPSMFQYDLTDPRNYILTRKSLITADVEIPSIRAKLEEPPYLFFEPPRRTYKSSLKKYSQQKKSE